MQFNIFPRAIAYIPANSEHFLQTDLVTQVIYDLAQNPEIIEPLRKEIIDVLTEGGWKKTSLYNLKLMDSVIKETQRLKPLECGKALVFVWGYPHLSKWYIILDQ